MGVILALSFPACELPRPKLAKRQGIFHTLPSITNEAISYIGK